jgi:hypothetical protein
MRNRFCLILLIVAFAVVGFMVPVQADGGTPVAVVVNGEFDFGAVYEGVDVVHDFVIQNKGDADLEITDVKAG